MRRSSPPRRPVEPDVKYNNVHITMFVNRMMYGGKKSTASRIIYDAFELMEERAKRDPVELYEKRLLEAGIITEEQAKETRDSARKWAIDARKKAITAPMPDPSNIEEGVYAD